MHLALRLPIVVVLVFVLLPCLPAQSAHRDALSNPDRLRRPSRRLTPPSASAVQHWRLYPPYSLVDSGNGKPEPQSARISMLVEPEDGVDRVVKALDAAEHTILVSAYILSQHRIIRALDRAAAQGLTVCVLLEKHPFGIYRQPQVMFSLLKAAGIRVRWAPPYFQYSHAKFMVLDDRLLILSSANFSQSGFSLDRDFVIFDPSSTDVREADNIFRADWDRIRPVLDDARLVVSPIGARAKLYGFIDRTRRSLDLYSEEVFDRGVVRRLIQAAGRGVLIRVLATSVSTWAKQQLRAAGIRLNPRPAPPGRPYIHAKAMIADGRTAFVGSENISATSLGRNRELGLVLSRASVVRRLERVFHKDW